MSELIQSPSLILPFSQRQIGHAIELNNGETPFHLYSQSVIERTTDNLQKAFGDTGLIFKNHYAVKALPNPHVLAILAKRGMGMDCSSVPELRLAEMVGVTGEGIMFTSNNTTLEEFEEAKRVGAIINLDDITHVQKLKQIGFPEIVCCRYNPGAEKVGNSIIGESTKQKYGMRKDQIIEAYRQMKEDGVKRFGLHAMMVSNEKNVSALIENARILFGLAREIYEQTGVSFEFINLGGGIGVAYRPSDYEVNIESFSRGVAHEYGKIFTEGGIGSPKVFMENGRYITGPAGALITRVKNIAEKYQTFVGVDASMHGLMRPGMYNAYHHITAVGREGLQTDQAVHVTGSLCENNDQFTAGEARLLPVLSEGDILAIHTTGAHGHSMGFNYNGKLRPAEILVQNDGTPKLIRRAEEIDDLFRTIIPLS